LIMPRSPWLASAGARTWRRVPVDASVARDLAARYDRSCPSPSPRRGRARARQHRVQRPARSLGGGGSPGRDFRAQQRRRGLDFQCVQCASCRTRVPIEGLQRNPRLSQIQWELHGKAPTTIVEAPPFCNGRRVPPGSVRSKRGARGEDWRCKRLVGLPSSEGSASDRTRDRALGSSGAATALIRSANSQVVREFDRHPFPEGGSRLRAEPVGSVPFRWLPASPGRQRGCYVNWMLSFVLTRNHEG
jgi:hypothetical protein